VNHEFVREAERAKLNLFGKRRPVQKDHPG
jgi:hypothetical protein